MYWQIIKNDWKNLTADRTIWLVAAAFALLSAYAIYNGAVWTNAQKRLGRDFIAQQEQRFAGNKEKILRGETKPADEDQDAPNDPYAVGAETVYAVLPPAPLAFTSIGQSDLLRPRVGVSVLSKQRTEEDKQGFENPLLFLAGRFDLAFVVVYLLPLLILALSFNLLSWERENGTLQMVLSQPVSLAKFALAKTLHRATLALVLIFGTTTIGLFLSGANPAEGKLWGRFLLWLLAVTVYSLFWFALALFVNSLGRGSATNALILAGCWIALVLVVPSLVNVAVTNLYPMPSRTEEISAIRSVALDMRRDGKRLLNEFYQDHPELAPQSSIEDKTLTLAFITIQQELKHRLGEVENKFDAQLAQQQAIVNRARLLSPSIVMQESLNDIAGSGVSRYRLFRAQAKTYARAWDANFLPLIFRNAEMTAGDYDRIPRFNFVEQSFGDLSRNILFGLLGILVPAGVLLWLARARLGENRFA